MRFVAAMLLGMLCPVQPHCQTTCRDTATAYALDARTLDQLGTAYSRLNTSINSQTHKFLLRMQRKEARLEGRLQRADSARLHLSLPGGEAAYRQWDAKLKVPLARTRTTLQHYLPGIDSMTTAFRFLNNNGSGPVQLQKLQSLSQQLGQLQGSFQHSDDVLEVINQRVALLGQMGYGNRILGMQKEIYYYQQQLSGYKHIINDQQRQQQLVLAVVRKVPAFQAFWQKNSMLAQLFPLPGNSGTLLASAGLQTSAQVGNLIQQRLGTDPGDGGANAAQYLQQQVGGAQGQVDQLKDKLDNLGVQGGGSSDMTLPDFSPNSQKQKTFLKRLEYGFNIQTAGSTQVLPSICTLALSLGYRISDKVTAGTGLCYLLGTGNGLNHIRLSNQGVGLRSYVDVKGIKSWWITGGYEYNYMQEFAGMNAIKNLDVWAKSALIGLTKKYNVGKRQGNVQLLYDILAAREVPRGQALKLRFGFSF